MQNCLVFQPECQNRRILFFYHGKVVWDVAISASPGQVWTRSCAKVCKEDLSREKLLMSDELGNPWRETAARPRELPRSPVRSVTAELGSRPWAACSCCCQGPTSPCVLGRLVNLSSATSINSSFSCMCCCWTSHNVYSVCDLKLLEGVGGLLIRAFSFIFSGLKLCVWLRY